MKTAKSNLNISLLGLGEYNQVLYNLYQEKRMDLSDITCLLTITFISTNKFNTEIMNFLEMLNSYLIHRDKKILKSMQNHNISGVLVKILEKI